MERLIAVQRGLRKARQVVNGARNWEAGQYLEGVGQHLWGMKAEMAVVETWYLLLICPRWLYEG